jgi:hypothetical protein
MTVVAALAANPLEDATAQLQHAIDVLGYDYGTYRMRATSRREMSVSVPIRRTDGSVTVVVGHRVQHNVSRGPANGGLRYSPNVTLDEVRARGMLIGTVSTQAKAEVARAAGADHVISYDNFADEVRNLTDGRGVAAVYDGVGAATFDGSLAALRTRGTLAIYGTASGPPPPLEIPRLNSGGSLYVTRPSVVHYTVTTEELRGRTDDIFAWLSKGVLTANIGGRYPLTRVRDAFADLEARQTTGKLVLVI